MKKNTETTAFNEWLDEHKAITIDREFRVVRVINTKTGITIRYDIPPEQDLDEEYTRIKQGLLND